MLHLFSLHVCSSKYPEHMTFVHALQFWLALAARLIHFMQPSRLQVKSPSYCINKMLEFVRSGANPAEGENTPLGSIQVDAAYSMCIEAIF